MAALSLVFDLLGRDVSASKAFNNVGDAAERAGKKGEGFGSSISGAMKVAGGALLASGIVEGFKGLYDAAAESAKIGALTANAIKSTGGAAKISAKQVGDLAAAISNKTGVDDEAIQSGANLLLTFTNVRNEAGKGNDIFNQTTSIMTDMAAVLGTDASGSAIQLGKALNDPVKGVSALTKVGVSFTDQQKEQIKTLVESGDTLGAQKVILAELSKEFGGAAEAAATPFDKLKVNLGNLQETIGTALMPAVANFSTFAVNTLLPNLMSLGGYLRDKLGPVFGTVKDAIGGVYDLIVNGDFSGQLASAFNISEDNPVVDFVLDARDSLLHAWDNLGNLWAGLDVSGLGMKIRDAAVAAGGDLLAGFKTGLDTGNWAPLGESIIGIVKSALSKIGELAGSAYEAFKDLMGKVDWVGIGMELGKQVPTLLAGLAIGILNFDIGGLLSGLGDHWFEAIMALIALAFTPVKVVGKIGEILAKIPLVGKFLEWMLLGLKGLVDNIAGFVGDIVGRFAAGFVGEGTRIGTAFRGIFDDIYLRLLIWGDNIVGWFRSLPGKLLEIAEYLGARLRAKFDEILAYLGSIFRGAVDNIANVFRPLTDRLAAIAQTAKDWVVARFTSLKDSVVGIFTGIRDTVGSIWDGIQDKIKAPLRVVFTFVNDKMIGPVNNILGKFPGGLQIPFLPRFAAGGLLRGPGTGTSDSILGVDPRTGVATAAVSNGEFVVNAKATAANLELLRAINAGRGLAGGGPVQKGYNTGGFNNGIIDKAQNAASAVKDFATDMIAKGARKAAELVLGPLVSGAKSLIPDKFPLNMLSGGIDKLYQAVLGKGDEQDKQQAALSGGTFGSSGKRTPNGVGGLGPVAAAAREFVMRTFGISNIGGYSYRNIAGTSTLSDHATGHAIDVMIANYKSAAGIAQGNSVASYFVNNAAKWGVKYVIWKDQINSGQGWEPYGHPGGGRSDTLQHRDHDHVSFYKGGGLVGYETGTSYVPVTGPAILHRGEAVLTAGENAARSNGPLTFNLYDADNTLIGTMRGLAQQESDGALTRAVTGAQRR